MDVPNYRDVYVYITVLCQELLTLPHDYVGQLIHLCYTESCVKPPMHAWYPEVFLHWNLIVWFVDCTYFTWFNLKSTEDHALQRVACIMNIPLYFFCSNQVYVNLSFLCDNTTCNWLIHVTIDHAASMWLIGAWL